MSDMVRMGLRPASLALAAALCFGSSAQAADDPLVAQASVTLSGLSFQLIDLTPGDGIAPSLSFQTQGIIDSSNMVYAETSDSWLPAGPTYSNSLLPSTPLNYVSADSLSSITSTGNSITLQSNLPLSQVLPALTSPDGTGIGDYVNHGLMTGTDLNLGNPFEGTYQSFTLGAGTGLVLRGTLSNYTSVDRTAVQSALEANGYDWWSLSIGGNNAGIFQMAEQFTDNYPNGYLMKQGNVVELVDDHFVTYDSTYYDDGISQSHSASSEFEFTVVNFGDSDLTGMVALNLMTNSDLNLNATRYSIIPPAIGVPEDLYIPAIPEPSTYALMGLGLVGIATVARRRRHTA